jgi:16S rRNA (uracil1498-N3)-methyltransferase
MLHLYIQDVIQGDEYVITDKEQLHHLTVVLRARHADSISLFDRQGGTYHGSISQIKKSELRIKIDGREKAPVSQVDLTLACAIPKASGMDDIIDQLTQLGVNSIIPMITERVVVKPFEPEKKLERWRKIALNAAEQSQRNSLPEISAILKLDAVIQQTVGFNLRLIPTLEGQTRPLHQVLENFSSGRVVVLIGPEGDFTAEEVKKAIESGFVPVSLGNNVLRVETAAAAVAAYIKLSAVDA